MSPHLRSQRSTLTERACRRFVPHSPECESLWAAPRRVCWSSPWWWRCSSSWGCSPDLTTSSSSSCSTPSGARLRRKIRRMWERCCFKEKPQQTVPTPAAKVQAFAVVEKLEFHLKNTVGNSYYTVVLFPGDIFQQCKTTKLWDDFENRVRKSFIIKGDEIFSSLTDQNAKKIKERKSVLPQVQLLCHLSLSLSLLFGRCAFFNLMQQDQTLKGVWGAVSRYLQSNGDHAHNKM